MRPRIHKILEFRGIRYYKRGAYYRSDPRKHSGEYMHRDVWAHFNGPIPKGHHVHHKDGNPANNDIRNLELISASAHAEHHSAGRTPVAWRKGVAAARKVKRDWRKAANALWAARTATDYKCVFCGDTFQSRVIQRIPLFCGQNCQKKYRRREAKPSLRTDRPASS